MKTLADMEQKAAALKVKQERAAEAAEALREYEAERANLADNIARLRTLRLEHEARQQQQATANKAALKATLLAQKATTITPMAPAKKTATVKKAG